MKLFFDTETTGKADFRAPANAEHQPRLVQLAALLTDDAGREFASFNCIVQPDGFRIPDAASSIHGITTEEAMETGLSQSLALMAFGELWEAADLAVAHNISFDKLIMDVEFSRSRGSHKVLAPLESFCTMLAMTPICQLPGNYGDFKWPKLQEAHKHAFGEEFVGAHDAMADVRACARVYFWLKQREAVFKAAVAAQPLPT